jgi:transcriptional regulator with XRE-family HTH domain
MKRRARSRARTADGPLVTEVRQDLGVDRRTFARLTGYSERAIANWESGRALSASSRQRIAEIRRLQEALARVMKPSAIGGWIETPNRAFKGLKPLEVIERGEIDSLWRMIFRLEAGIAD